MKLIIGLGNPGGKYALTRHNLGHMVVDKYLKAKPAKDVIVRKSGVFMNSSGEFVKQLTSRYPDLPPSGVYIIHDDLDLPLGTWKIQLAKGPRDHGGVKDIEEKLGTKDFWRVRVGVDNRERGDRIAGEDYVLQNFPEDEKKLVDGVIAEVCKKLATL